MISRAIPCTSIKVLRSVWRSGGPVLSDDTGFPELAKIQMIGFTFVAVGIFLATLIHQIHAQPPITTLPAGVFTMQIGVGSAGGVALAESYDALVALLSDLKFDEDSATRWAGKARAQGVILIDSFERTDSLLREKGLLA